VLLAFRALNTLGDIGNLTSLLHAQQDAGLEKWRQQLIKTTDVIMCCLVKDTAHHYEEVTKWLRALLVPNLTRISHELIRNWVSNCAVTSKHIAASVTIWLLVYLGNFERKLHPYLVTNFNANFGYYEQVILEVMCLQKFENVAVGFR
jgi:hypothetical protein